MNATPCQAEASREKHVRRNPPTNFDVGTSESISKNLSRYLSRRLQSCGPIIQQLVPPHDSELLWCPHCELDVSEARREKSLAGLFGGCGSHNRSELLEPLDGEFSEQTRKTAEVMGRGAMRYTCSPGTSP